MGRRQARTMIGTVKHRETLTTSLRGKTRVQIVKLPAMSCELECNERGGHVRTVQKQGRSRCSARWLDGTLDVNQKTTGRNTKPAMVQVRRLAARTLDLVKALL